MTKSTDNIIKTTNQVSNEVPQPALTSNPKTAFPAAAVNLHRRDAKGALNLRRKNTDVDTVTDSDEAQTIAAASGNDTANTSIEANSGYNSWTVAAAEQATSAGEARTASDSIAHPDAAIPSAISAAPAASPVAAAPILMAVLGMTAVAANSNNDNITPTVINRLPTGSVTITNTTSSTRGTTTLQNGDVLTAANTLVDADGLGTITYIWKAGGTTVGTGATYTLAQADVGKTITVVASYTDALGKAESVSSSATDATLPLSVTYEVTPVLGPLNNAGAGLRITLYKKDTTVLGEMSNVNGKFTYTDTSGYSGVLIVKLIDTNTATDYLDEATGQGKSLNDNVLLTVVQVAATNSNNVVLSVNPLTTVAALKLGVTPAADKTDPPVIGASFPSDAAAQIIDTNKAVAKAFGVVDSQSNGIDITTVQPKPVITTNGSADFSAISGTDAASAYGRALAVFSQAERASGQTTTPLATKIANALNTTDGALTNSTAADHTEAQSAIALGIVAAQAADQITTAQATNVAKAFAASPIAMLVASGADSYLNAGETTVDLVITGTFVAGQTLQLLNGTTPITFTVANTSDSSYAIAAAATSITVTVAKSVLTDASNNTLQAKITSGPSISTSNPLVVVVDSTVETPNAQLTADTNNGTDPTFATDHITNNPTITAPANAEQGAKVEYRITKGSGTAGAWSTTYTAPTTDGTADDDYTVEVRQTDLAHNVSDVQTIHFTLDSSKPVAPNAKLTTDSGTLNDGITNSGAITPPVVAGGVSGTIEVGAKVEYRITKGSGMAGAWSSDYTAPKTDGTEDGDYKVEVRQTDKAGNVGNVQTISFKLDSTGPSITSTSFSVDENQTAFITGGTLTANETVTWSLGTEADTALFALGGTNGNVLSLLASKDYETSTHQYTVNVVATDSAGNVKNQAITVNLNDANEAPKSGGTGGASIGAQTAVVSKEGWSLDLSKYFTDVDANDALTYAITSGTLPQGLMLTNGVISGTPTATTSSTLNFTVKATDKAGQDVSQNFSLDVVSAPVVQSFTVVDVGTNGSNTNGATLGQTGEALSFAVKLSEPVTTSGQLTAVFTVNGTDVTTTAAAVTGKDTITFTGANVPAGDGSVISLKSLTGAATITGDDSHNTFVAPTEAAISYAGYRVDNTDPSITSSAFSANENTSSDSTLRSFTLAATDASTVTWSFDNSTLDGALFSLSDNTLSFNGARNFESAQDTGADNVYEVNVTATDAAGLHTVQKVAVTVNNVNEAPTYSAAVTHTPPVSGDHDYLTIPRGADITGTSVNLAPNFTDPDGSTATAAIQYSLASGTMPTGLTLNADGTITGKTTATGDVTLHVKATDGTDATLSGTHDYVLHLADAPVLTTKLGSTVTNLDVTSNLVLSVGETVTAVAGKKITLTDVGGTRYHGENVTNSYTLTFNSDGTTDIAHGSDPVEKSSTAVQINGTGQNTRIVINLSHDLDFASNYTLAVDDGAFYGTTSQQNSVAFTTVSFSTVTPDASKSLTSTAGASQSMTDTGDLQTSYTWLDMANWGVKSDPSSVALNLSTVANNKLAFVSPDYQTELATQDLSVSGLAVYNINLNLTGFGADNLIYFDDLGRNEPDAIPGFDGIGITPTETGVNLNIDPATNESNIDGGGGNLDFTYTGALLTAVQQANPGEMISVWKQALNSTHAPVIYG